MGLKMAPKWIDLSECMQCFKAAGQRCKAGSSCSHISSVSRLHITCISSLPAMTDTDASAGNPPTNPFLCTHHLPQIPFGKSSPNQLFFVFSTEFVCFQSVLFGTGLLNLGFWLLLVPIIVPFPPSLFVSCHNLLLPNSFSPIVLIHGWV